MTAINKYRFLVHIMAMVLGAGGYDFAAADTLFSLIGREKDGIMLNVVNFRNFVMGSMNIA
ncbi:MAG: hypothetical protein ACOYJD_01785 [Christensenellales bacterium]